MSEVKSLADAQKLIAEKNMQIDDNHITQYIMSAIDFVEKRGESLDDYALIKVQNPMQLKHENTVQITSQWRIVHKDMLENVPVYED
jgi:hypothetical protein